MPDGCGLTGNVCKKEPGSLPVSLNQHLIPGQSCSTFPRTSEPRDGRRVGREKGRGAGAGRGRLLKSLPERQKRFWFDLICKWLQTGRKKPWPVSRYQMTERQLPRCLPHCVSWQQGTKAHGVVQTQRQSSRSYMRWRCNHLTCNKELPCSHPSLKNLYPHF